MHTDIYSMGTYSLNQGICYPSQLMLSTSFSISPNIHTHIYMLQKEMATHSSILAWEIPWTENLAGWSPWGCKESDKTEHAHTHTHIYIYWILSLFKYTTYRYLKRDGGVLSVSFYRCVEEEKGFLDPVSVSGCAWKLKWQRQINKRKAYRFFPPDLFHMNVMWHGSLHRKWKQTFWCMLSLKSGESREMW